MKTKHTHLWILKAVSVAYPEAARGVCRCGKKRRFTGGYEATFRWRHKTDEQRKAELKGRREMQVVVR